MMMFFLNADQIVSEVTFYGISKKKEKNAFRPITYEETGTSQGTA